MKVTQAMMDAFTAAAVAELRADPKTRRSARLVGIQAVLDLIGQDRPDVEPFAFTGHPDNMVYVHGNCGTVIDVLPQPMHRDMWADIEQGNCDCETSGPWFRIYVEKAKP